MRADDIPPHVAGRARRGGAFLIVVVVLVISPSPYLSPAFRLVDGYV